MSYEPLSSEEAIRIARKLVVDNVEEVHNDRGGTIGYILNLTMKDTARLMALLHHEVPIDTDIAGRSPRPPAPPPSAPPPSGTMTKGG